MTTAHGLVRDLPPLGPVLDGLEANAALVDADGTILLTNRAWDDFARANGGDPTGVGVGTSYFSVCVPDDPVAREVAEGLRAVLDGGRDDFTIEYPCHSPTEERWFRLRIVPVPGPRRCVLALHHDVTADVKGIREQAREALFLRAVGDPASVGSGEERPLAQRARRTVELLALRYAHVVERSWDAQVLRTDAPSPDELASIADALAAERATARDAVALHVEGLRILEQRSPADRVAALSAEARIALITVLGLLADRYRAAGR